MHARAQDNNPSALPVGLYYQLQDLSGGSDRHNPIPIVQASNTDGPWATNTGNGYSNNTGPLTDGNYAYSVYARSQSVDTAQYPGSRTAWYGFTIDQARPPVPTVSSYDFPQGAWGAPYSTNPATAGTFAVSGSADTAGYSYSFDTSSVGDVADTTCTYTGQTPATGIPSGGLVTATSGVATIPTTSLPAGPHTLYVKAFDAAHNPSAAIATYSFYVAPLEANEGTTKFEAETLAAVTPVGLPTGGGGSATTETATGTASNNQIVHLTPSSAAATTAQAFTFTFTVGLDADYALGIRLLTGSTYGKLTFTIDGNPVLVNGQAVTADGYSAASGSVYVQLGGANFSQFHNAKFPAAPFKHTVTVNILGKNASSTGYDAAIDLIRAVPINNVTAASFAAAMNNHGISHTNDPANFGPNSSNIGLASTSMATAGIGSGATFTTTDGVTFTMPTTPTPITPGQPDNVIATGQTIPLNPTVQASYVDLLVASTCGQTANSPAITVSINFVDGYVEQPQVPVVPEISASVPVGMPATITLATTVNGLTQGTATIPSSHANIYHLHLPTNWTGSNVASITLPNLGSTLDNTCSSANLHVFAVSTS